jgi:hypothetical protein
VREKKEEKKLRRDERNRRSSKVLLPDDLAVDVRIAGPYASPTVQVSRVSVTRSTVFACLVLRRGNSTPSRSREEDDRSSS